MYGYVLQPKKKPKQMQANQPTNQKKRKKKEIHISSFPLTKEN